MFRSRSFLAGRYRRHCKEASRVLRAARYREERNIRGGNMHGRALRNIKFVCVGVNLAVLDLVCMY
jgi:hypothetical protein